MAYETALGRFRTAQDDGRLDPAWHGGDKQGLFGVVLLRTRHRYWMLNWYTFAALSLLCCVVAYSFLGDKTLDFRLPGVRIEASERAFWAGTAVVPVIVVGIYTLRTVVELIRGKHSYRANSRAWELLVELENAADRERQRKLEP